MNPWPSVHLLETTGAAVWLPTASQPACCSSCPPPLCPFCLLAPRTQPPSLPRNLPRKQSTLENFHFQPFNRGLTLLSREHFSPKRCFWSFWRVNRNHHQSNQSSKLNSYRKTYRETRNNIHIVWLVIGCMDILKRWLVGWLVNRSSYVVRSNPHACCSVQLAAACCSLVPFVQPNFKAITPCDHKPSLDNKLGSHLELLATHSGEKNVFLTCKSEC